MAGKTKRKKTKAAESEYETELLGHHPLAVEEQNNEVTEKKLNELVVSAGPGTMPTVSTAFQFDNSSVVAVVVEQALDVLKAKLRKVIDALNTVTERRAKLKQQILDIALKQKHKQNDEWANSTAKFFREQGCKIEIVHKRTEATMEHLILKVMTTLRVMAGERNFDDSEWCEDQGTSGALTKVVEYTIHGHDQYLIDDKKLADLEQQLRGHRNAISREHDDDNGLERKAKARLAKFELQRTPDGKAMLDYVKQSMDVVLANVATDLDDLIESLN
jgi:hypothetical protein